MQWRNGQERNERTCRGLTEHHGYRGDRQAYGEGWRRPLRRKAAGFLRLAIALETPHIIPPSNYLDAGDWSLPGEGKDFQSGSTRLHVPCAGVRNA